MIDELIRAIEASSLSLWEKVDLRSRLRTWEERSGGDPDFRQFLQYKMDLIAQALTAGASEHSISEASGCHNLGPVEGWALLRSSQPSRQDLEWLGRQGVKTVVNLRRDLDYGDAYSAREEASLCRSFGIRYIHVPMDDSDPPPPLEHLREAMRAWVEAPRPSLLHCWQGLGRTGMVTMLYRIEKCGWTIDQALLEAQNYGYDGLYRERQIEQLRRHASRFT